MFLKPKTKKMVTKITTFIFTFISLTVLLLFVKFYGLIKLLKINVNPIVEKPLPVKPVNFNDSLFKCFNNKEVLSLFSFNSKVNLTDSALALSRAVMKYDFKDPSYAEYKLA